MADKKANSAHYLRKTEMHVFINQVQSMNEVSSFGGKQLNWNGGQRQPVEVACF